MLEFWRAQRCEQIDVGIEVLRGQDSYRYVVEHVYALYRDLVRDLRVVFCALSAPDLSEPFPVTAGPLKPSATKVRRRAASG